MIREGRNRRKGWISLRGRGSVSSSGQTCSDGRSSCEQRESWFQLHPSPQRSACGKRRHDGSSICQDTTWSLWLDWFNCRKIMEMIISGCKPYVKAWIDCWTERGRRFWTARSITLIRNKSTASCDTKFPRSHWTSGFSAAHFTSIWKRFMWKFFATCTGLIYIIVVDKSSGPEKGYPKFEQTFQADFNELFLIRSRWSWTQYRWSHFIIETRNFTADPSEYLNAGPWQYYYYHAACVQMKTT